MLFEDFKKIINVNKPVVVMFYANWCTLSLRLKNIFIDMLKYNNIQYLIVDIDKSIDICNYCTILSSCIIQVYYKNKIINQYFFSCKEDLIQIINNILCVYEIPNNNITLPCIYEILNNNVLDTSNNNISKINNNIILPKIEN
jgi:hypothetical protein